VLINALPVKKKKKKFDISCVVVKGIPAIKYGTRGIPYTMLEIMLVKKSYIKVRKKPKIPIFKFVSQKAFLFGMEKLEGIPTLYLEDKPPTIP